MCYCPTPTLHLNLALTGDGAFLLSPQKTHSVWFISVLNYGDTENVLINHLLLVIPMSYPCHYTNLCPHKPHKHAHTHTHTHTHTHIQRYHTVLYMLPWMYYSSLSAVKWSLQIQSVYKHIHTHLKASVLMLWLEFDKKDTVESCLRCWISFFHNVKMAVIYPGIAVPYFSYYQLTENEMYEYFRNNKKKWEHFSAEASIKCEFSEAVEAIYFTVMARLSKVSWCWFQSTTALWKRPVLNLSFALK